MQIKIDRSDWTPTTLGEVVAERRKSTKDLVADGLQHIVGLEHIDAESIHLRRSEPMGADTTFTKTFKKGDILFGRRRAYLKKAAQAPFAGICSGDITVMYAKDGLLLELLPFLINNDNFFDYAVTHSAGGLSPRVKFRDLANYPFLLPPKAEQERLAELLWAGDAVLEGLEEVFVRIEVMYKSKRESSYFDFNSEKTSSNTLLKTSTPKRRTFSLEDLISSISYGSSQKSGLDGVGTPVLGIPNVVHGKIIIKKTNFSTFTDKELDRYKLNKGDILIVRTNGNQSYVGRSALVENDLEAVYASYLIKIEPTSEVNSKWLSRYLQTIACRNYFERNATSSAGNYNINTGTIKRLPVVLSSMDDQKNTVEILESIEIKLADAKATLITAKSLQKSLINQIF